jgi:hypothetical protein
MEREGPLGKIVVLVLAVAVLATLADAALSRRRVERQPRILTVSAEAYAEAEPDVAKVSLGVKAVRPTPAQAAAEVARKVAAIRAKLGQLGIAQDAVETSELYLGEASEYDYKKGRYVRLGYKAYHWLRVTLKRGDFGKLAAAIDGAVKAGATSLSGLVFEMEDDNALRAQALGKATTRARQKAEAMATAARTRIVGVQRLSDTYTPHYRGWYDYEGQAAPASAGAVMRASKAPAEASAPASSATPAEAPAGTPEVPGKLRITCDVEVAFLLG